MQVTGMLGFLSSRQRVDTAACFVAERLRGRSLPTESYGDAVILQVHTVGRIRRKRSLFQMGGEKIARSEDARKQSGD